MDDLSCQELAELATDYLEGALAPAEHARFEAHVLECPGCEIYLEQLRATITLAGVSAELEQRPEVIGLLTAFKNWPRP